MAYSIQQLDFPTPVIVVEMRSPHDPANASPEIVRDVNALLVDIEDDLVYVLFDMSQYKMNFGDLIAGLGAVLNPHSDFASSPLFHSRVKALVVGSGSLMNLLANSLKQDQYGKWHTQLFSSRDEALAFISQA